MTYAQRRRALAAIARRGDTAHTATLPIGRWMDLRSDGLVVYLGVGGGPIRTDVWALTARGRAVLAAATMPANRPSHHARQHRRERTPQPAMRKSA